MFSHVPAKTFESVDEAAITQKHTDERERRDRDEE
jgi:hypothetical protein